MTTWTDRLADRIAALVAIRSTADRPEDLRRALDLVIEAATAPGVAVRRFESNGRPSALLTHGPDAARAGGPFRIVFNAHLDVVPGTDAQFVPRRDGDRLHGRGTQDMKAAALVMAEVFRTTAGGLPFPVALQLVTDEEIGGGDGTAHQLAEGVRAGFVVIGEHSGLRLVTESKGIGHARLTTSGRAAHAAYPWLGDNALLTLTAALDRLLARHPVPPAESWVTTVNVARVETPNTALNQVPDEATAWLDLRWPASDPVLGAARSAADLEAYLTEVTGVTAIVDAFGRPGVADPGRPEVTALREALVAVGGDPAPLRKHGAADSRHYHALGIDAVICGPRGDGQHGPAEYVDLGTLRPYHDALTAFLRALP